MQLSGRLLAYHMKTLDSIARTVKKYIKTKFDWLARYFNQHLESRYRRIISSVLAWATLADTTSIYI